MTISIPAIHIDGWQLAFLVMYAMSCGLAWIIFSINIWGGGIGAIPAFFLALIWPVVFVAPLIIFPCELLRDKFLEWKEKRRTRKP